MTKECSKCQTNNPDTQRFCGECGTYLTPPVEADVAHTKTLTTPLTELKTGSVFGDRYQIIEELGRGGMGRVYRAIDKELDEEVAIKLIKPEISLNAKTIERFKSELKLARKIIHKKVGRMFELMEDKGTRFITMEYVRGENLKIFKRRVRQLAVSTTISIARQICEGLIEAHKLGIVHRDLKPSNIMIDKEGNVRIMDFGIARSLDSDGITDTGMAVGTPEYMSPEQVEGLDIDQRSDIYSLGVIIYEMATGDVPFKGNTPYSIALKHKSESPREPIELNEQVSEGLNHVILKCMEKDKTLRYQSVMEIYKDLEKIQHGIPTTDRIFPKKKESKISFFNRHKFLSTAGILLIATVFVSVAYYIWNKDWINFQARESKPQITAKKTQEQEKAPDLTESSRLEKEKEPGVERIPVKPEEKKTESKQDIIKPEKTSAKQPQRPATQQSGDMEINSIPVEAKVYINDEPVGQTPLKKKLLSGIHKIRISRYPEYNDVVEDLEVKSGETLSKTFVLMPLYILDINTFPAGAQVRIDGQIQGQTPLKVESLRSTCRLSIEMGEGWTVFDESMNLNQGVNTITQTLQKIEYMILIETQPPGADISIDEKHTGRSPLKTLLTHGTHLIQIDEEGYKRLTDPIDVHSNLEKKYELRKLEKVNLRIIVLPFATVFLDGKAIGDVPPIKSLEIEEGKHTLVFVNEKLNKRITKDIELVAGADKDIRMNMATEELRVVERK